MGSFLRHWVYVDFTGTLHIVYRKQIGDNFALAELGNSVDEIELLSPTLTTGKVV